MITSYGKTTTYKDGKAYVDAHMVCPSCHKAMVAEAAVPLQRDALQRLAINFLNVCLCVDCTKAAREKAKAKKKKEEAARLAREAARKEVSTPEQKTITF